MKNFILCLTILTLASCSTTHYYVVRHAEKQTSTMTSDVPLTKAGEARAIALREYLQGKKINQIYSTNYQRTKATVKPLADLKSLPITIYQTVDEAWIAKLRDFEKGGILIAGHSNTVDDIVNGIMKEKTISDLNDSDYGGLYHIRKRGVRYKLSKLYFGPITQ